jgi:RHS repeat-associated protein
VLVDRGSVIDLNAFAPSGWTLFEATAINSYGDIVGKATLNGQTRAFLLTMADLELGSPTAESDPTLAEAGDESNPTDGCPVDLANGDKRQDAVDLIVSVAGTTFALSRQYNSNSEYESAPLCGNRWTLSCFEFAAFDDSSDVLSLAGKAAGTIQVDTSSGGPDWPVPGSTTQTVTKTEITLPGLHLDEGEPLTIPVWRLREPGAWQKDFYRTNDETEDEGYLDLTASPNSQLVGLLLHSNDVYGNEHSYQYTFFGTTTPQPRLMNVRLNATFADETADAEIRLFWDLNDSSANLGRIERVEAVRYCEVGNCVLEVVTDKVEYSYMDDDNAGLNDDLGITSDLIQVTTSTRMDPPSASEAVTWRVLVTQYRYHRDSGGSDGVGALGNERYIWAGSDHQLKMVIQPEQIEYYAQIDTTANTDTIEEAAAYLLGLADGATAFSQGGEDYYVADLASKIIEEYETSGNGRVLVQHVQSACGCGGAGTQGKRKTYTYWDEDDTTPGATTIRCVEETRIDDETFDPYRTYFYEMTKLGDSELPYLWIEAVQDDTPANAGTWMQMFEYDANRNRIVEYSSSSLDADYEPGDGSIPPTPPTVKSSGLVHVLAYNSENRLIARLVNNGDPTWDDDECTSCDLIEEITYPASDTGSERKHLPSAITRYRVAGSTQSDNVELTEFEYGFHGSTANDDDVAWIKTIMEAEATGENGPGGNYVSFELFDVRGLNYWSVGPDDVLTYREFQTTTGQSSAIVYNADPAGWPSSGAPSLTTESIDDRSAAGGSLTTEFIRDPLGRVQQILAPGGVNRFVRREMRLFEGRPDIDFYAVVTFPHDFGNQTFAGPASITWMNASGSTIGESTYAIDSYTVESPPIGDYPVVVSEYELDVELSRTEVDQDVSGLVSARREWHDVTESIGTGYYETTYDYDRLGRLTKWTNPNGTVREQSYDMLDRLIVMREGTTGATPVATTQYEYDSGGVGNGNLTSMTAVIDGSTGDRVTQYTYDERDRLILVENPLPPHELFAYDNLDRLTQRALYETVPTLPQAPTEETDRALFVEMLYGQRGLMFRERQRINPGSGGSSQGYLHTDYWFDEAGRVVGFAPPTSARTKTTYDGLGRPSVVYTSDGYDASADFDNAYSDVFASHEAVVSDDIVLEQMEYSYIDGADVADLVTTRMRNHFYSDSSAGDLTGLAATKSIVAYQGFEYDAALRPTKTIDFGTNHDPQDPEGLILAYGGPVPTKTGSGATATWDDDSSFLSSSQAYDARGLIASRTDPGNFETLYFYDDMNRTKAIVENAANLDESEISWSSTRWTVTDHLDPAEPDTDRVTSYVYDGLSNVIAQVAHLPGSTAGGEGSVQVTAYDYGVSQNDSGGPSDLDSNDLLRSITYHDSVAVAFGYNRQDESIYREGRNDTIHEYEYDSLGRLTLDHVTDFGTQGIDDTIKAIRTDYDFPNRTVLVRSYTGYSGTQPGMNVANAVRMDMNDLGQVINIWQEHDGDVVDSGGSPSKKVSYSYDHNKSDEGNFSRPLQFTYPDAAGTADYLYGSTSLVNHRISRLQLIWKNGGTFFPISPQYEYLGLLTPAVVDLWDIDVQLDRTAYHSGDRNDGEYPGFDRFGRPIRHTWVDGGFEEGTGGNPNIPPIVELTFQYDTRSNLTQKLDARPGASWSNRDTQYDYDGISRLVEARRGNLVSTNWTWATQSERWELDMLGNWAKQWIDIDGDEDFESDASAKELDQRTHNTVNELTERLLKGQGTAGGDKTLDLTFDSAGNLITEEIPDRTLGIVTVSYIYDAWNRLVLVEYDSDPREAYTYDGLHHRITVESDSGRPPVGSLTQRRNLYYDAAWRLVEEHIDEDFPTDPDMDRYVQYFWGIRGPDDIFYRRMNSDFTNDGSGVTYEDEWFHLTDHQFSTVAVMDETSTLIERVVYDPYGGARHHFAHDVDANGSVTSSDTNAVYAVATGGNNLIGQSNYKVEMDFDRDGDVDSTDHSIIVAAGTTLGLPTGWISSIDTAGDNPVGYGGYLFNRPTLQYAVRHRVYDTTLGRWLTRDPIGYADGMNLYEYMRSSPGLSMDAFGLTSGFSPHEFRRLRDEAIIIKAKQMAMASANNTLTDLQTLQIQLLLEQSAFIEKMDLADQQWADTEFRFRLMTSLLPGSGTTDAVNDALEGEFDWWSVYDVASDLPIWGAIQKAARWTKTADRAAGAGDSVADCAKAPKPLGKGSTGRTQPRNLDEKLAMKQAMSRPDEGLPVPLRKGMTDKRWPGSEGWMKMRHSINGIEIHYVYNKVTKQVDDFKFKD